MLSRSGEFDATIQAPHEAVSEFHILDGASEQIALVLEVVDCAVSADSDAAQLRSVVATVGDPDGTLTPTSLADLLGPGGSRARSMRGVRVQRVVTVGGPITTAAGWTPTTSVGQLNGVVADADGALRLGWV